MHDLSFFLFSGSISSLKKKLIGPNSLIVNHDPHDSHSGMQHIQWGLNFRFHTKSKSDKLFNLKKNNFMMCNAKG